MPRADSIQEYEQAREDRLWDAMACVDHHRHAGSVYLLGFAAEMALKCAYFRRVPLLITEPIQRSHLDTAKGVASRLGVLESAEGFHNVRFWSELLKAHRVAAGDPLDPSFAAWLDAAVAVVHDCWWIEMRYKRSYSLPFDLDRMLVACDWIDKHYPNLYR